MDVSDWILVVEAVVLGHFALLGIEFMHSHLGRRQRRQDRRDDFQRKTLIELQEALFQYNRTLAYSVEAFRHQVTGEVPPKSWTWRKLERKPVPLVRELGCLVSEHQMTRSVKSWADTSGPLPTNSWKQNSLKNAR
jgi:hypothetical protein